jgi:hypothetical protein
MTDWSSKGSETGQPEDELDFALSAMRGEPAPEGPSQELVADTLAGLSRAAVDHQRPIPLMRRILTVKNVTISAGVLSAAAVLLIMALTPATPTFADAIKSIQKAHVVSYTKTETGKGLGLDGTFTHTSKVYERGDGAVRVEDANGVVTVHGDGGKTVFLDTKAKTLMALKGGILLNGELRPYLDRLEKAVREPVKELGEEELDGRKVRRLAVPGCVVWVDARTGQPVRIAEIDDQKPDALPRVTYSNIQIEPKDVNDSTFSTDVPAGYAEEHDPMAPMLTMPQAEDKVLEAIRVYTWFARDEKGKPRFPDQIDNLQAEWDRLAGVSSRFKSGFAEKPWFQKVVRDIAQFLQSLPKDGYAYLGKDKNVGQKGEIIFWCKKPDGSCAVIYGNLLIGKVKPEDLPKK